MILKALESEANTITADSMLFTLVCVRACVRVYAQWHLAFLGTLHIYLPNDLTSKLLISVDHLKSSNINKKKHFSAQFICVLL
jgi:hypothetical protein